MNIALYDIDLYHAPARHKPNLELMKTYNYYYKSNHKVTLVKPSDDLTRFSKVIYFKDAHFNYFPKTNLSESKAILYGQGFYNYFESLPLHIHNSPPSFLPYDLVYEKITGVKYEHLKQNSIIRLENKDITGFKENSNSIYFVDQDITSLDFSDFFHEYHNYNFYFYNAPRCHNLKQFEEMEKFSNLIRTSISIDFKYDKDFVEKYQNSIAYPCYPIEDENDDTAAQRVIKTILLLKKKNLRFKTRVAYIKKDTLLNYIVDWGCAATSLSYFEYYKDVPIAINLADATPAQCRLLLKTKPQNGVFDFT